MKMIIEQVSAFIENKPGRLVEILSLLAEKNIDLRAYSVAEKSEFGILRMLVDRADDAVEFLKEQGFTAKKTEVLGIVVPHLPGSSVRVIKALSDAGINVEYTYAFVNPSVGSALLLIRVKDNALAEAALSAAGIQTVGAETLY
jgi:hypothetical protein